MYNIRKDIHEIMNTVEDIKKIVLELHKKAKTPQQADEKEYPILQKKGQVAFKILKLSEIAGQLIVHKDGRIHRAIRSDGDAITTINMDDQMQRNGFVFFITNFKHLDGTNIALIIDKEEK